MSAWVLAATLVAGLVASGAPAAADDVRLPPAGHAAWKPLSFPKVPKHTVYTAMTVDGAQAWQATAECSASAVYVDVNDIDLTRTPRLGWRWRVEQGLDVEDEQSKAGDDFAARVYLTFHFDEEHATWTERLRHRLGRALYGDEISGNTLVYVWTSRVAPGTSWGSPYASEAKVIALERGSDTTWREADVDVVEDYERLFGRPAPKAQALAVMSDSDGTCAAATAYFADFRFRSR